MIINCTIWGLWDSYRFLAVTLFGAKFRIANPINNHFRSFFSFLGIDRWYINLLLKTENDYLRSIETGVLKNENLFPKVIITFSHSVRVWTKVWTVNIDLHVASFSLLTETRYSAVIFTMLLISYNITYYSFGITTKIYTADSVCLFIGLQCYRIILMGLRFLKSFNNLFVNVNK